jgi:Tol biopolymer transport system component
VRKDGLEIVFDSNRAGTFDIFIATRGSLNAQWSSPKRLDADVNSDTADETRPSLSRDGLRLYFGSTRANAELGGAGGDIYVSTRSTTSRLSFPWQR